MFVTRKENERTRSEIIKKNIDNLINNNIQDKTLQNLLHEEIKENLNVIKYQDPHKILMIKYLKDKYIRAIVEDFDYEDIIKLYAISKENNKCYYLQQYIDAFNKQCELSDPLYNNFLQYYFHHIFNDLSYINIGDILKCKTITSASAVETSSKPSKSKKRKRKEMQHTDQPDVQPSAKIANVFSNMPIFTISTKSAADIISESKLTKKRSKKTHTDIDHSIMYPRASTETFRLPSIETTPVNVSRNCDSSLFGSDHSSAPYSPACSPYTERPVLAMMTKL